MGSITLFRGKFAREDYLERAQLEEEAGEFFDSCYSFFRFDLIGLLFSAFVVGGRRRTGLRRQRM